MLFVAILLAENAAAIRILAQIVLLLGTSHVQVGRTTSIECRRTAFASGRDAAARRHDARLAICGRLGVVVVVVVVITSMNVVDVVFAAAVRLVVKIRVGAVVIIVPIANVAVDYVVLLIRRPTGAVIGRMRRRVG